MSSEVQISIKHHVKLYTALVDQLQRYNTVIWQAPTALLAANVLALDKFRAVPAAVVALSFLNAAIIFAFFKMVVQQQRIIEATRRAEDILKTHFNAFIPVFRPSSLRAPRLMVLTLTTLNLLLLFYGLALSLCSHP